MINNMHIYIAMLIKVVGVTVVIPATYFLIEMKKWQFQYNYIMLYKNVIY